MNNDEADNDPNPWQTNYEFNLHDDELLLCPQPNALLNNEEKINSSQQFQHFQDKIFRGLSTPKRDINYKFICQDKIKKNRQFSVFKNPTVGNVRQNGIKISDIKNQVIHKSPLIRMHSCYPKVWKIKCSAHKNLSHTKLQRIQPLITVQQNEATLTKNKLISSILPPQKKTNRIFLYKFRSKSDHKKNVTKFLRINTIPTYSINENFNDNNNYFGGVECQKSKKQVKKKQNGKIPNISQFKNKSSDKQEQFGDLSFFWTDKYQVGAPQPKQYKIKRTIQYKDKWSINLMKKTALTNIQIQNRHNKGASIYI